MSRVKVFDKHSGLLIGLIITGVMAIVAGSSLNDSLMVAIGGALFGGSISSLIGKLDGHEFQNKTLEIIRSSLDSKLISNESRIKKFRKQWHVYYATKSNGNYEWRHVIWDFREKKAIGLLSAEHETYSQTGEV